MWSSRFARPGVAAAAAAAVLGFGVGPLAVAAPATDDQGFIDSTARCTSPSTAVVFGSTASSRVAICKDPGGQYEYRGVRVSDGAKLTVPASQSGNGQYVAENNGITYTVTSGSLEISAGNDVIRQEPMEFFHGPPTQQAPPPTQQGPAPTQQAPAPTTTTPTTPLPPPLPAEVGGSRR